MSTKIYNAFQYDGNINELIEDLKKFREQVIPHRINKFIEPFNKLIKQDDLPVYWSSIEQYFLKMILWIDREWDTPPNCVIYFHKKKIYFQLFGLDNREIEMFNNISNNFLEFWYSDNTDLDSELKKRKKVWDWIFEKSWIPEEVWLTFEFFPKRKVIHYLIDINNSYKNNSEIWKK